MPEESFMKIIIAPDSFKGSISSVDAAAAMGRAVAEKVNAIGISAVFSIANGPISLEYAMEHASELIEGSVLQVMRAIRAIQSIRKEFILSCLL